MDATIVPSGSLGTMIPSYDPPDAEKDNTAERYRSARRDKLTCVELPLDEVLDELF